MTNVHWKTEAEFFDRKAADVMARLQPTDPRTIHRYGTLRRRRFNKEYRYRLLGDLRGRRILDVGCGDGKNAITLAKLGATVTGIDISAGAIQVARRRAEINGVDSSTRFICSALENADLPDRSFDLIWGDAILHHLLHDLPGALRRLARWGRPGATVVFSEPVNLNRRWRQLRLALPIPTDATPGERPLEPSELALVQSYLEDVQVRYFALFDRLSRFILVDYNYEAATPVRRAAANLASALDFIILSVPAFQSLAGYCVMYGHLPGARPE